MPDAGLLGGGQHLRCLAAVQCQWLLHQDVLAGGDGGQYLFVMEIDRRAHRDEVEIVALDERSPVGREVRDLEPLTRGGNAVVLSGAQRHYLEVGHHPEGGCLYERAPTDSDDPDSDR